MTPRLVIFDCDGTLADSQHLICAAMDAAFASERLPAPTREATLSIVGLSLPDAIFRLVSQADEATVLRLCQRYKAAFGDLRAQGGQEEPLYPGAAAAIAALARQGIQLGLATGKSRRGVARLLGRFGLDHHFATIQTADDAPSKPHPAMILQAMAEVGADPAATVMVGDTTFDMEMAVNARVAGLGVAWGYHPPPALKAAGARAVAPDFPSLTAMIDGLAPKGAAA